MIGKITLDRHVLVSSLFLFVFSAILFLDFSTVFPRSFFFTIFLVSFFYLLVEHGKNPALIPLLLFSLPYTAYFAPYYLYEIPYHYLTQTQSLKLTNNSLALQHIFYHIFFAAARNIDCKKLYKLEVLRVSKLFFYGLSAFMMIMLVVNIAASPPRFNTIYDGSNTSTVWIEYSYVFLLILVCSNKSKQHLFITGVILSLYALYPLLYSRRLQFIMVCLLFYYVYFIGRYRPLTIYFFGAVGFLFLRILESTRMGVSPTISSLFLTTNSEGVVGSNQGGVMVSSTVYLHLMESAVFDFDFRIKSFFGNMLTGILPGFANFSETYINLRALETLPLPGNGGFTGVYFFLWLGFSGTLVLSFVLSKVAFPKSPGFFVTPLMLAVLITFPRLHSYNVLLTVKVITLTTLLLVLFWASIRISNKAIARFS